MKGIPRIRIVTALLAALAVVSIVPLVGSTIALVRINREALETAEKKFLTSSSRALAESIAGNFRKSLADLRKTAEGLRLMGEIASREDPFLHPGTTALLGDIVAADPNFIALRVLNHERKGSTLQPDSLAPVVIADLKRAYDAAMRGETFIGDPLVSPNAPDGGVVMAVPVLTVEKDILGVVEAFVSLQPVKAKLMSERNRSGVQTYIVDRRGALVLASDAASFKDGGAQSIELVGEFMKFPLYLTKSYTRGEGPRARRVLGSVAPLNTPDWGVIVEKNEADAFASVSQMTQASTYGAALALLFAAVVAFFAARALSRPVTDLVQKVKLIAEGSFSQRVTVRGARELAQLAESFNAMTGSLEQSIEKLKQAARENQELFINSVRALTAAIDAKDPYTRGHSERVARYAVASGKHMGCTPEELRRVKIAALLHDVGKIGIEDKILRKPTALTDEEFEVMKTHPIKGAIIMGQIPQLKEILPGIKYHHEKWEGGGYPDGLVREEIPLLARIVTVADTFDAMTTTRPYQKAMAMEYVVQRIKSFSGTRFDPVVVSALEKARDSRDLEVVGEAARMAVSA